MLASDPRSGDPAAFVVYVANTLAKMKVIFNIPSFVILLRMDDRLRTRTNGKRPPA
jgi:hypothetical protein